MGIVNDQVLEANVNSKADAFTSGPSSIPPTNPREVPNSFDVLPRFPVTAAKTLYSPILLAKIARVQYFGVGLVLKAFMPHDFCW